MWGTIGKTGRQGAAQKLLVLQSLLLIETKPPVKRDGVSVTLNAAIDDPDLIIEYFVRLRDDQLVRVSSGVRGDCEMVSSTFNALIPRMKTELGVHVTAAMSNLMHALRVSSTSTEPCAPSPSTHVKKHTVLIEHHGRTPFEATTMRRPPARRV